MLVGKEGSEKGKERKLEKGDLSSKLPLKAAGA